MAANFKKILEEAQQEWIDLKGVQAVGEGKKNGKPCIDVYVSETSAEIERTIPTVYKSVPVNIRESGGTFNVQSSKTNGSLKE